MNATKIYIPRPGSLPSQCLNFFRNNPDELLTLDDITDKFDCTRGNIHTMLKPCLDAGQLVRDRSEDGDYFYKAGPGISIFRLDGEAAEAPPQPKKRGPKLGTSSPRHHIDLTQLKIEKGIPCMKLNGPVQGKWDDLFAMLKEPGDSVDLPGYVKGAVASAAFTRNKLGQGQFKCYMTSKDSCRIWRLA